MTLVKKCIENQSFLSSLYTYQGIKKLKLFHTEQISRQKKFKVLPLV